jgi:hypothetical protein
MNYRSQARLSPASDYAAKHAGIDEPLTINAETVAEYLARQNKPGMERWVRTCGERIAELIARVAELTAKVNAGKQQQSTQHRPRFTGD